MLPSEPDPISACEDAVNEYDKGIAYLDKNKKFRKPSDKEIAQDHYVSTEQALDRAATVCTTMCGLRVCYDNLANEKTNPDGHYGDRNGRKLNWVKRKDGRTASCDNCVAAQADALFRGLPEKECAR
jgi:hypothetical protein